MRGNIAVGVFNVKTRFFCIQGFEPCKLSGYEPAVSQWNKRITLFAVSVFHINTCILLNRLQLPLGTQDVFKLKTPLGFEPINRNVHTLKEAVGMIVPTYCCRCLWFCDKVLLFDKGQIISYIFAYSATGLLSAPFVSALYLQIFPLSRKKSCELI